MPKRSPFNTCLMHKSILILTSSLYIKSRQGVRQNCYFRRYPLHNCHGILNKKSTPKKNDEDAYVYNKSLAMEKCCNSFLNSQVMPSIITLQVDSCVQSQTVEDLAQISLVARLVYSYCRMSLQRRESHGGANDPVIVLAKPFTKDLWLSVEITPLG